MNNIELNEIYHISDPDKIDILADIVYDMFLKNGLMSVFNNRIEKSYGFDVSDIKKDNPCGWLADDNTFGFVIRISNKTNITSSFSNYENHGYIEQIAKDDSINVLHGALFLFTIDIDIKTLSNGFYSSEYKRFEHTLKSRIAHELGHAYKELFIKMMFKPNTDEYDHSKSDMFFKAYKNISNIILNNKDLSENEKEFLEFIYRICYIEKDAHIRSFYNKLRQDKIDHKDLKNISEYEEYSLYYRFMEDFNKFVKDSIILKYSDQIYNIFNKRFTEPEYFYKKSKSILVKIIDTLEHIYDVVDKYGTVLKDDKELEKHRELFNEQVRHYYGYNHLDETTRAVIDNMLLAGSKSIQVQLVRFFDYLLNHKE